MRISKEQEVVAKIIEKCWSDQEFKQKLMNSSDPVAVIEQAVGTTIQIPEGTRMEVVDQSNSEVVYLNIPAEPDLTNLELDEEQMELVSGGGINYEAISKNYALHQKPRIIVCFPHDPVKIKGHNQSLRG